MVYSIPGKIKWKTSGNPFFMLIALVDVLAENSLYRQTQQQQQQQQRLIDMTNDLIPSSNKLIWLCWRIDPVLLGS
jgi:hypothetical protein